MKKVIFVLLLFSQMSCSLIENNEKKAIEMVKKAKAQADGSEYLSKLLNVNSQDTWLDFANTLSKKEPNKQYTWNASKQGDNGVFLVSFYDETRWGLYWEVNINEELVKLVNSDEYLSRKYGVSKFDRDSSFTLTKIKSDTMKIEKEYNYYTGTSSKNVVYVIKASVVNKTKKIITDAKISGILKLIFKDRIIVSETKDATSEYVDAIMDTWLTFGFKNKISKSKPWLPDSAKEVTIKTKGMEEVYLNYEPEYVVLEINLHAEDPLGFTYEKNIQEMDVKSKWLALKKK